MKTKKLLSIFLAAIVILGVCNLPIIAAAQQEGIIHSIAEKYSGEELVNDPNMAWFAADLAVYESVYQKRVITPTVRQACVDKIIADISVATAPSVFAKSIIALRALGYDARNLYTADFEQIDLVKKLTDMVDEGSDSVRNEYTLPYVILALQQGNNYASAEQMAYLISEAITNKAAWQSTVWGTDAATPMLLALAPYYNSNEQIKVAIDETIPLVTAFQDETGLISNAASHGLAMTALSALGIDSGSVINNGKNMFDGIMTQASDGMDGFVPDYNSFSTEQGFRGLLSTMLPLGTRIYDFSSYPYNEAHATWSKYAPVTFDVVPKDSSVIVEGFDKVADFKYDLPAGTHSYTVSHSVYQTTRGTVVILPEEAEFHIPKTISVSLSPNSQSPSIEKKINVKVKVMAHNKNSCSNSFTYKNNASSYEALANETISIKRGSSVLEALKSLLNKNNISFVENNGYVSAINNIKEFEHGNNSGWMFTVDGNFSEKGSDQTILSDNQSVIWFYTDNYNLERNAPVFTPSSGTANKKDNKNEQKFGLENKNPDIKERKIIDDSKTFNDIDGHGNQFAIEELAKRNIIHGKDNQKFEPNECMTRAEFATIIVNSLYLPTKEGRAFTDISEYDWFYEYVNTAYAYGIIKGISENEFNPEGFITKEEAAVMIMRAASLSGIDTTIKNYRNYLAGFSDYTSASLWANDALAFCYKTQLLSDEMTIQPIKNVCRGEIAQLLYNMMLKAKLLQVIE